MAAERARQAQQLEAFVNQNAARPCTPSTVLREARVRHSYDVNYLLRATAPPSGLALPPSRRSPSRHQFGRLNIAAAAASGCTGSGPAVPGTGHAAFGREEVDGEDLDEADLRMLDAGFAGEGDGWRGDPRQRRGPRLPVTITIKAPAPHRFGSVLLAPPGAPGATAVAASAAVDSGRDSSIRNGSSTCAAGSLVQLVSARSTRLGPHIDSPPPAAHPTPYASGTKRISFACVPDAPAAGLSGPGGPSGTGSSGSSGGSKVTRAPPSVAVLMDRVSEDQVAAVLSAGVAAAMSPRARTADPHSHHPLGGGYGPRGGGGSGGGGGVVGGGGGVLQPSCSPRVSARGRDGACRQATVMPGAAGTALGSRGGGGTWTRRFSLECQQPTLAMSSLAGGSLPGENASSTGGAGHASVRGPCVPGSSCSGATQQGQHAAAVVAPPQQLADGALLPRACSPCCLHSTPRSVVGGRAATASTAAGRRGAVAGGSPPPQAAIRRGPSGPAAAGPCCAYCGGPPPATTTCSSSVASDAAAAAAAATPFSATSSCSSPQSHRASPLPSACSSPVPPSAAFTIARRRSIDPQLSVVGGRASSRAGSGSLAVGAISSCCPATGSTAACGGLLEAAAGSSNGGEPAGRASVPALACACGSGQADGLEVAGCATGSGSCTGTDKAAAGTQAVPVAAATPAPPGVAGLGSQSAPLPNVASSPPAGDAHLQHHHQQFQHQHPWPPSRAAQLPLSAEDVAGSSHHGSTTTAVSTAGIHPYPHWHGGSHVMFPELAAADTATAAAMAGRATTSGPQLESLPLPRLASCGSGGGGETGGGVHAGAVTCRISELSSSGRSVGEYQRATSRARRYSAPYPESVSGTSAGASTRVCHGSVNGYSSNQPSQPQLSSRAAGTADAHRFPAGGKGYAAVEPALASERASPAAGGGGGIPEEPHLHYSYPPQHPQQQQQQQQRRRPSDHEGSDGGALPPPQQRHSQSGAAQQPQVHVIGPVASPAAAAATEAAAVSRMTRVMRAESRKGPADQDWTLDPEEAAAHAARVLGAASADQVPAAAAGTAAFGRGHCVRLHGHAHEPAAAPRVSGSGDASGGGAAGAAACAFPEEARRRSSHAGEGGADAAAAALSASGAPPAAGLGSRLDLGLSGPVGPAVLAPASAAGVAGHGHGQAALPHLPQPQRLPFLPGVSRLRSRLTPGGPQQQPAAAGLPAAAVSSGGTGSAHVPPTSAGSWSASAAAAANTCAAASRGPISPAGAMRQQQQVASSRPVTSGARHNATPASAKGVSPPPSPPLTAKPAGRSHKRAGTATAATAAAAAAHAMPSGSATAAGHAASCRGSAAPFGTGREGPTADCTTSGRGADAAAKVAADASIAQKGPAAEMEERASILLRIKNALSFLHRDE